MADQKTANRQIVKSPNTVPAPDGNPYIADGIASSGRAGTLLKFNAKEGKWVAGFGDDARELSNGLELVAGMLYYAHAWTKWQDSKRVDTHVTPVGSGNPAPLRHELGDTDEALWELDDRKEPRDPWQYSKTLPLVDPQSGEQYLFETGSVGGKSALGRLALAYGRNASQHPQCDPVVQLASGGYDHKVRVFGYIHTPDFPIVRWVPRVAGEAPPQQVAADDEMNDEIPF